MKKITLLTIIGLSVLVFTVSSCSKDSETTPVVTAPTLYDSLGGTALVQDPTAASGTKIESGYLLIRNIIDSTIFVIAADNTINGHFQVLLSEVTASPQNLTGYMALSKNLSDFVAVGTGATNFHYTGLSMHAAHDPAENSRMNGKASNADFTAFENDLVAGAAKNGVTTSNQALKSVAAIVESLRGIVVQQ